MEYHDVVKGLLEIENELKGRQEDAEAAAIEATQSKADFERKWAEIYLKTEGTVEERKQQTILILYRSEAYKHFIASEAMYSSWKAVTRILESRASVLQSILRAQTREVPQDGQQPQWSRTSA